MNTIKLILLVVAAYLHQHTWAKCTSEDTDDTVADISCSGDDVELSEEISYLKYRTFSLNRVNILLDNVYSKPLIAKSVLEQLSTPVTLTVTNTRMSDFDEILILANVTSELSIHNSFLTKLKFDDVLILKEARKLNVSHNLISVLKSPRLGKQQQLMDTIDLSHNFISSVPNNCFAGFSHLKYLNLSHNSISYLSVAAFEGISQLESLYLSYNKLSSIANIAIKLRNLKSLHLDYNYITKIEDFNSMIGLEELKLRYNQIKEVKENSLLALSNLTILDLSGNKIPSMDSQFVNSSLRELHLTDIGLKFIYPGAFKGMNITRLFITGNKIILLILPFFRLKCDYLDLSNNDLKYVGNYTFSNSTVRSINLSTNAISEIKTLTFSSVNDLQELDLSNNALTTLAFLNLGCGSDLKKLYFHKNMVDKVSNNTFAKVPSLEHLDLSYNVIQSIESGAFIHLKKLENLLLHNNRLFSIQIINFEGLSALLKFDLSYTEIGNFTKAAVSGLKTTIFNCSHAELSYIHFDTFAEVEHIDTLDLSYNSLVTFEINPKGISSVESLYLNNNQIASISNVSFAGFIELQTLHLEFNNIVNIHPKAFSTLKSLKILNLSDNKDLQVTGDVFSNLRGLASLTMMNNKKSFDFQHTENASFEQVDLSLCDIADLRSLYIFNVNGVVSLNLSKNLISFIDKNSFKTMPKLAMLDISFNLIKTIEPGSFINTKNIVVLNLHGNELSDFQHGVFQGLTFLQTLNISNNLIHDVNINLLHSCTALKEISFENNLISNLEFKYFLHFSSLKKLYFGGNNISCHDLGSFKIYLQDRYYNNIIMSEAPNYHIANVDGVTCRPNNYTSDNDGNCTLNPTGMSTFTDALEKISKSIDNFNQDYYVKGIFNILILSIVAFIIFLIVKYFPIKRYFCRNILPKNIINTRRPVIDNLDNTFRYSNVTQRSSNDYEEFPIP